MPAKRKPKKAINESLPARLPVRIQPDPKPDTPSYYVNFAAVSHSEYDFMVTLLRVPTQLTPEQTELAKKGSAVPVEPILQLIVPPRLVKGLITALSVQKENYEREYGPIRQEKNAAG